MDKKHYGEKKLYIRNILRSALHAASGKKPSQVKSSSL